MIQNLNWPDNFHKVYIEPRKPSADGIIRYTKRMFKVIICDVTIPTRTPVVVNVQVNLNTMQKVTYMMFNLARHIFMNILL